MLGGVMTWGSGLGDFPPTNRTGKYILYRVTGGERFLRSILIANRGEIAVRIARAAHDLGLEAVAVQASDDAGSLHSRAADRCLPLGAAGPAAYLDIERLLALAVEAGCDAVHPGYGFLSERADFARACRAAALVFVGPEPEQLETFGDKEKSRDLARRCGVPLLPGDSGGRRTCDRAGLYGIASARHCGDG